MVGSLASYVWKPGQYTGIISVAGPSYRSVHRHNLSTGPSYGSVHRHNLSGWTLLHDWYTDNPSSGTYRINAHSLSNGPHSGSYRYLDKRLHSLHMMFLAYLPGLELWCTDNCPKGVHYKSTAGRNLSNTC